MTAAIRSFPPASAAVLSLWVVLCACEHATERPAAAHNQPDGGAADGGLAASDLTRFVDPRLGTAPASDSLGFTFAGGDVFPGAVFPLGMIGVSPDTSKSLPGGYDYREGQIYGFSLTHFSGRGCSAYGDAPIIPWSGAIERSPGTHGDDYRSSFSHANESASAGYYRVHLDSGIDVELTSHARSAFMRVTFPPEAAHQLIVNAGGSVNGTSASAIQVDSDTGLVTGSATSHLGCVTVPYTVYFAARVSAATEAVSVWHGDTLSNAASASSDSSAGVGAALSLANADPQLEIKLAVSYVSVDNALVNLDADTADMNFDAMHSAAASAWNQKLQLIQVDGPATPDLDDRRTVFYTALYHVFLHPNLFSDANGEYLGFDNAVHQLEARHAHYHNIAGWDQYRSLIRLRAILNPDETSDIAQSLVNDAQQGDGTLPRWEQTNHDSRGMNGDGGSIIVAEAFAFGARAFDAQAALTAAVMGQPTLREGFPEYDKLGYVPLEAMTNSAAVTLEYCQADAATAQLAHALGDDETYAKLNARSRNWMNLYNPATGYIQPRGRDGKWPEAFDPASETGFQEGSAAQYLWMVPDPHDLVPLLGGEAETTARLDHFFAKLNEPAASEFAFLGNEVGTQSPWLYGYAGAPSKTQALLRRIERELYTSEPNGLPGNDDGGSLSSSLIFAELGLFPLLPGTAGFVLASPAFDHIRVLLPDGTLQIDAVGDAQGPYTSKLEIDGVPTTRAWIPWQRLAHGARLTFTRSDEPTAWGSDPNDTPPGLAAP